jgi:uncharacterized damage-inducible protein DinB
MQNTDSNSTGVLMMQYAEYNVWANSRMLELVFSQPSSVLNKEIKSSFPSIRKTILHIWDAETLWLKRLRGEPALSWPSKELDESADVRPMLRTSQELLDFLSEKDPVYFKDSTTYKNIAGEEFTNENSGIIMHVMNHSTFHRGQVVTMIRESGFSGKIESTDLISFLRQR